MNKLTKPTLTRCTLAASRLLIRTSSAFADLVNSIPRVRGDEALNGRPSIRSSGKRPIFVFLVSIFAVTSIASADELQVQITQQILSTIQQNDGGSQLEVEFTLTNTSGTDLYDVRIVPQGSTDVPIDLPDEPIGINVLPAGATESIVFTLDTHSPATRETAWIFGRIEAVNTTTLMIESRDFGNEEGRLR